MRNISEIYDYKMHFKKYRSKCVFFLYRNLFVSVIDEIYGKINHFRNKPDTCTHLFLKVYYGLKKPFINNHKSI